MGIPKTGSGAVPYAGAYLWNPVHNWAACRRDSVRENVLRVGGTREGSTLSEEKGRCERLCERGTRRKGSDQGVN